MQPRDLLNVKALQPPLLTWCGVHPAAFWKWWSSSACVGEAPLDQEWRGADGIGICGPAAYKNEPEGKQYSNLFFDEHETLVSKVDEHGNMISA